MLNLLGRITTLRAKAVLGASIVLAIVSLLIGSTAIGGLTGGGYQNPASDSANVFEILENDFKAEEPHLTIAVGMKDTPNAVRDPQVLESVSSITEDIAEVKGVGEIVSFWQVPDTLKPQFQSADASLGLIFVYINPDSLDLKNQIARDIDDLIPNLDGDVEYYVGGDTVTAVKVGLQKSGKIITAAALLLAVVFAAFVSSGVTNMKMLGFGIAFAILLDATIVRGLLVPAFMKIANSWNWWAPKPLQRIHQRFGLKES